MTVQLLLHVLGRHCPSTPVVSMFLDHESGVPRLDKVLVNQAGRLVVVDPPADFAGVQVDEIGPVVDRFIVRT
jgi:hypothetical protein